jgi:hypothetical protein
MSGIPLVHPFGEPSKIRSSFDWAQGERIFGGSTALFRIMRLKLNKASDWSKFAIAAFVLPWTISARAIRPILFAKIAPSGT